jgi:hypothetical protein
VAKRKDSVREYLAGLGRKGAASRYGKMSAEQRRQLARKAALARWSRKKKKPREA